MTESVPTLRTTFTPARARLGEPLWCLLTVDLPPGARHRLVLPQLDPAGPLQLWSHPEPLRRPRPDGEEGARVVERVAFVNYARGPWQRPRLRLVIETPTGTFNLDSPPGLVTFQSVLPEEVLAGQRTLNLLEVAVPPPLPGRPGSTWPLDATFLIALLFCAVLAPAAALIVGRSRRSRPAADAALGRRAPFLEAHADLRCLRGDPIFREGRFPAVAHILGRILRTLLVEACGVQPGWVTSGELTGHLPPVLRPHATGLTDLLREIERRRFGPAALDPAGARALFDRTVELVAEMRREGET